MSVDEDDKGYIAIGEAVISHIFNGAEITRDSLLDTLRHTADEAVDERRILRIREAEQLFKDASPSGDESMS